VGDLRKLAHGYLATGKTPYRQRLEANEKLINAYLSELGTLEFERKNKGKLLWKKRKLECPMIGDTFLNWVQNDHLAESGESEGEHFDGDESYHDDGSGEEHEEGSGDDDEELDGDDQNTLDGNATGDADHGEWSDEGGE